jgi:Dolichyl-phosphate-mannose-protein mannosyltransferase
MTTERAKPSLMNRLNRWRANPWARLALLISILLVIFMVWITPLPFRTYPTQRILIRGGISFALLFYGYVVLYWRAANPVLGLRRWGLLAAVAGGMIMAIQLHYLDRFPQLNQIDEVHNWSVQWTFANTGLLGEAMYRQFVPLPQPIYDTPHYAVGMLLRLFGDDFWQARFARMLLSMLALPFIYLCGKHMYGPRTGLMAVVAALLLLPPTAYVRPDFFVGVMLSIGLYVYLRSQDSKRFAAHYLVGLLIALTVEGHPSAYRFGLAAGLLYGARWLGQMVNERRLFIDMRLVALALGGLTSALIYVSIHILPNTEQGLHFFFNNSPAVIENRLGAALGILNRQALIWAGTSAFELALLLLGAILAFYGAVRGHHGDRLLVAMVVVGQLTLMGTYAFYREFYQVHWLPIYSLLIGRLLAGALPKKIGMGGEVPTTAGRWAMAVVTVAACLLMMYMRAVFAANDPSRQEFTQIAKQIKASLPPALVVVANENYFMELQSLNFYGIQTVTTPNWFLVDLQGYALWEATNPDVFIITPGMDTPKYTDYASIRAYMRDHGFELRRCFYGDKRIAKAYSRAPIEGWEVDSRCRPGF